MEHLFKLTDVSCSYGDSAGKVLHIPMLEIPRGKITFLLGASGSGKSTLLETLGLMNRTLAGGRIDFSPEPGSPATAYDTLWESGGDDAARIRKKHFSFIFQETNLMENFTAYENICLSSMIKRNEELQGVMKGASLLMNRVKLGNREVPFSKLAVNLSGGQRQRVSFVRALNAPFTVLFGDEPTGNLDEANANDLLALLKAVLDQKSAAIIVSHDINLALKFADMIAVITKDPIQGFGEVLKENVFQRDEWTAHDSTGSEEFRKRIRMLYRETEKPDSKDNQQPPAGQKDTTYRRLFLMKEGKALFGRGLSNILVLSGIMFFTLLALGFANGSLVFLRSKLNDAFVNWLTVKIPYEKSGYAFQLIRDNLNEDQTREKFAINSATSFLEYNLAFYNRQHPAAYEFMKGRTIETGLNTDPILAEILKDGNRVAGDSVFSGETDFGLIVTREFLEKLGYSVEPAFIMMAYPAADEHDRSLRLPVPVPVRAVVKDIPGKNGFISTVFFYKAYLEGDDNTFDIRNKRKNLSYFISGEKKAASVLKESAEKFIGSVSDFNEYSPEVTFPSEHTTSFAGGFDLLISFSPVPESVEVVNSLASRIESLPEFRSQQDKITRFHDFSDAGITEIEDPFDMLCINFSSLDSVESFSRYLHSFNARSDASPIQVDSAHIVEKQNFRMMSNITLIISVLLLLFAIICISLFISNILKMHLNKVRMNIGTFKAFGLGNSETRGIYLTIMACFISLCMIISFCIAMPAGIFLDDFLAARYALEEHTAYFLADRNVFFVFVFIFLTAMLVSWYHIRKLLSRSPGDLIYNR